MSATEQGYRARLPGMAVGQRFRQWCNMLKAWLNWTICSILIYDSCVRKKNKNKKNNKAKLRPALYVRSNAGKNIRKFHISKNITRIVCFFAIICIYFKNHFGWAILKYEYRYGNTGSTGAT
jgi:hypothetical protein